MEIYKIINKNGDTLEVECSCGVTFYINEERINSHSRCPKCTNNKTNQEDLIDKKKALFDLFTVKLRG